MHNEFVVEFKDGSRDWIDPVIDVNEDDAYIHVSNGHDYRYEKELIARWIVRPYSADTTYDSIGEE
jgi:hypothetical protein